MLRYNFYSIISNIPIMPVPKKTKEKKNKTKEIYLDKMQISKQDGNDFSLFV